MALSKVVAVDAVMESSFTVRAEVRGHRLCLDQPHNAGGQDEGPTPLEQFLFALAGCIATIGRIAAHQQQIELRGMRVRAEGDFDPAGLLGKPSDSRVGFSQIRIQAEIEADLDDAAKAAFLDQVCSRCPVHDNLTLTSEVLHQLS